MDWLRKMCYGHISDEFRSQFICSNIWSKNPQYTGHWQNVLLDGSPHKDGLYRFRWNDGDILKTYLEFDNDGRCGYDYAFRNNSIIAWQKLKS